MQKKVYSDCSPLPGKQNKPYRGFICHRAFNLFCPYSEKALGNHVDEEDKGVTKCDPI